jgi:hypothetical protein
VLTKLHININDLNLEWVNKLRSRYSNASLEIIVHENKVDGTMDEDVFWEIIHQLDWTKEEDNEILAPAIEKLSNYSVSEIKKFQDILAEKLYQLDKQIFAEQIGEYAYGGNEHFSLDKFLYTRACVVANGKKFYSDVVKDPSKMPKSYTFEPLLTLAKSAFEIKTGQHWDYIPEKSYETYSNREGWGGKSWLDKL